MKLTPMTSHRRDGNQPHRFAAVMGPTIGPAAAMDLKC